MIVMNIVKTDVFYETEDGIFVDEDGQYIVDGKKLKKKL